MKENKDKLENTSTKERNHKILDILGWVVTILIVGFCLFSFYQVHFNKESNGFLLGHRFIVAQSGSMEPYLMTGGIAVTKEVDSLDDIEIGDVITYKMYNPDGSPVRITHRIISMEDGAIRTKGDNNNVDDNYYISIEQVEDKVIGVFNGSASFVLWAMEKAADEGNKGELFVAAVMLSFLVLIYMFCCFVKWLFFCFLGIILGKKEEDERAGRGKEQLVVSSEELVVNSETISSEGRQNAEGTVSSEGEKAGSSEK